MSCFSGDLTLFFVFYEFIFRGCYDIVREIFLDRRFTILFGVFMCALNLVDIEIRGT